MHAHAVQTADTRVPGSCRWGLLAMPWPRAWPALGPHGSGCPRSSRSRARCAFFPLWRRYRFQLQSSLPCRGQAASARNRGTGIGRVDVTYRGFRYGNLTSSGSCLWLAVIQRKLFCSNQKPEGERDQERKDVCIRCLTSQGGRTAAGLASGRVFYFYFTILQIRKLADRGVPLYS